MKTFPNGFESWAETHHEIVQYITMNEEVANAVFTPNVVSKIRDDMGTGGLYELAMQWTDEFEEQNKGRDWDGDFFDRLEDFLSDKNKIK